MVGFSATIVYAEQRNSYIGRYLGYLKVTRIRSFCQEKVLYSILVRYLHDLLCMNMCAFVKNFTTLFVVQNAL